MHDIIQFINELTINNCTKIFAIKIDEITNYIMRHNHFINNEQMLL